MRIRDLVPGVEYATCDGQLVLCNTPVGLWTKKIKVNDKGEYVRDEKTRLHVYEYVAYNPDELDPWGGCMDVKKPSETGVYVTYWHTDRDGKKTKSYGVDLVKPKDIKGTWKEFLVLHGEKVRQKADDAEAERLRKERNKELTKRFKSLGLPVSVRSSVWKKEETLHLDWETDYRTPVKVERLLTTLEKKLMGTSQS